MPNYHGQKALVIPKLVNITMIIFQTTFHADCDDRPVDMEEHDIGIQQNLILIYCIKRLCCMFNMYVLFHTLFQCMCSSPEKGDISQRAGLRSSFPSLATIVSQNRG